MTRAGDFKRRRPEARDAMTNLDDLPVEPISVRITTAVRLTGIPHSRIYELISLGKTKTLKIGRSTFTPYRCLE